MMCGGTGAVQQADQEVQALCDLVRGELESKSGQRFSELTAHSYTSQVVAGTNFFVKAHVGQGSYVHIRIYRPLPGQGDPQVHSYQLDKKQEDTVEYFQ